MEPVHAEVFASASDAWQHLEDFGWACVRVPELNTEQVLTQLWEWLASLRTGVDRNNSRTWRAPHWPVAIKGIFKNCGIGQSHALWTVRKACAPIFAELWDDPHVVTSFDGACMMQPGSGRTRNADTTLWPHVDLNPNRPLANAPTYYQGAVNLLDCGETDGGLVVWQGSHQHHGEFKEFASSIAGNWVAMDRNDPMVSRFQPVKVCCPAGTLMLWDSRTIHCNVRPSSYRWRAVAYVCMIPRSFLTQAEVKKREQAFRTGRTTSHYPGGGVGTFRLNGEGNRFGPALPMGQVVDPDTADPETWRLVM